MEHVRQNHTRCILGFTQEPGYGDLRHRRHRFSDDLQVFGRVTLPLPRDDLLIAFGEHVARQMAATRREIPDHRLTDHHGRFEFRLDLDLGFLRILAHFVPRCALP